jgi:aromatic-L-amino-acid decarboxylase
MTRRGPKAGASLDPADWSELRSLGHRMLDDMLDYIETIRDRPVWRPIPDAVRATANGEMPRASAPLDSVYEEFSRTILPYSTGNVHPGFMGWVHGGGTAVGMLAEMLAAGLNANLGGRDHMPIEIERQIARWMGHAFGFPETASGLFVTGTSMANLVALLVARTDSAGPSVRRAGLRGAKKQMIVYTSAAAHGCIGQAVDVSGLGRDALRTIPTDPVHRIDLRALETAVAEDRKKGLEPFMVVGTAGTVDIGAMDDLDGIAGICAREGLWFHVDGAFGALAIFSPELASRLAGIQHADSIAFDFHKWGQVPYDAGFILVRDGEKHRAAFAAPAAYLRRETRGLAAGSPWPCDFGPDLSRGFRALKTWFTLKTYGTDRLGEVIAGTCALAKYLERRIAAEPALELMAPVQLNIVCFRVRAESPDEVNAAIVADLHESGIAAPSTTTIGGHVVIRAAIVNHRTQACDVDALVDACVRLAKRPAQGRSAS